MPNTKSAIKAMRGSARKRAINLITIKKYKDAVKSARKAITTKAENVSESLARAYAQLDKAAKKHVIHPNKAARLKSRLARATRKV